MTEAPERIWAAQCRQTHSTMWWPDDAGGVGTEYIRKDVSDAMLAKTRNDALREAAKVVNRHIGRPAHHAHAAIIAMTTRWRARCE